MHFRWDNTQAEKKKSIFDRAQVSRRCEFGHACFWIEVKGAYQSLSGLSPSTKNMSKLGLTAEKIDIESNFSSENIRKCNRSEQRSAITMSSCVTFLVRYVFWGNVGLNVNFLSRQTEFGHIF